MNYSTARINVHVSYGGGGGASVTFMLDARPPVRTRNAFHGRESTDESGTVVIAEEREDRRRSFISI